MTRLPDFIIIGAMKCATSTLHEQLACQSGFFMSDPKEIYFFSDDPVYANGIEWYAEHFQGVANDTLVGESSTHYTKLPTYPKTVERIAEHLESPKFIYVMRHPIERLVSQYIHHWTMREVSRSLHSEIWQGDKLIPYSQYCMQLQPYFEQFGPENVLPVFSARLKSHPQEELERVCRFLGYQGSVAWQSNADGQNSSSQRMRTSWWRDRLAYAPGISQIRKRLPQGLRDRVKSAWTMKRRPVLSEQDKTALTEIFDKDLAQLGHWLGLELNCENFNQVTEANSLDWTDEVGQQPAATAGKDTELSYATSM